MNKKKLYRSSRDAYFAGICGGLGDYFNIDSNIVRIVAVLLALLIGIIPGIILYIVCAFILPRNPY